MADRANVIIKGEHFGLTFDKLWVGGHSVVEFGQQKDTLYIRFLHDMRIDKDAVLDFTKTREVFIYQHNEKTTKDTITTIGRVYFREQLAINGKNVNLIGDIRVP